MFHIRHTDMLTAALTEKIDLSESAAENGDYTAAKYHIDSAIELWEASDTYTHIFISHAEIDSASDCFFEAAAVLNDGCDMSELHAAFDALRYHLESIAEMERVRVGSIF